MADVAASSVVAAVAALSWLLLCLRWFDAAAPFRPTALEAVPPAVFAALLIASLAGAAGLATRARAIGRERSAWNRGLLLVVFLAILFRLPMAWHGAAGYVTADGALSGIMALDVRDGRAHDVFVPHVPYSGSLKANLTAPLAALLDPARAFALVSVLFYAAFVAAVYLLAEATSGGGAARAAFVGTASGLYAAFSPAFVTRYSLSNDGNYVEVLALGTWALVLTLRWAGERARRTRRAFAIGLLIGVAFWCHILAVIPAAAIALFLLVESPREALLGALPGGLAGFLAGDLPGLLWNAANGWESFAYLQPGAVAAGDASGPGHLGMMAKAGRIVGGQLLVLLGYDFGYAPPVDHVLKATVVLALAALICGIAHAAARAGGETGRGFRLVLMFAAVNLVLALVALPYIPGNPRYLLFLMAAVPVLLSAALAGRFGRVVFAILVAAGALASWAQAVPTVASDAHWRGFVRGLRDDGVRFCYTDFYLAAKINFLSGGDVTCSAKLGPTTTEYFFRFHEAVDAAPEAALVAVNGTAADKLARRLERLSVTYERREGMKPVLFRLSRKVSPEELFPDRAFPLR